MATTLILGSSNKPERYSYKAQKYLTSKNHQVALVHPSLKEIEGIKVYSSLSDPAIKDIETITVYVSPKIINSMVHKLIAIKPSRIIFNPGAEAPEIYAQIEESGIEVIEACTLVMLNTNQY